MSNVVGFGKTPDEREFNADMHGGHLMAAAKANAVASRELTYKLALSVALLKLKASFDSLEAKSIKMFDIKAHGFDTKDTEFHAEVVAKKMVRIFGIEANRATGPVHFDQVYCVGDEAIYDSYNMQYIGKIAGIGAKTVTIEDGSTTRRLDIETFLRRNRCEDLKEVKRRNSEWSD